MPSINPSESVSQGVWSFWGEITCGEKSPFKPLRFPRNVLTAPFPLESPFGDSKGPRAESVKPRSRHTTGTRE